MPRLARFAYELGAAQARWAGRVPDLPWLSRHWLAQYLTEGPPRLAQVADEDWDHPSVAVWPAELRPRLRRLHADHSTLAGPIAGRSYARRPNHCSASTLESRQPPTAQEHRSG